MNESRPTEWQWKTPEDGKIDGLTRKEWRDRGVANFGWKDMRTGSVGLPSCLLGNDDFRANYQYAPQCNLLPAAWPAKRDWQWRRVERAMTGKEWQAVPYWAHAGYVHESDAPRNPNGGIWESASPSPLAKVGEWWAPADLDGNPCAWPELDPHWRRVENGRIGGLTQQEWSARGVTHWCGLSGRSGVTVGEAGGIWHFTDGAEYAPMSGDAIGQWQTIETAPRDGREVLVWTGRTWKIARWLENALVLNHQTPHRPPSLPRSGWWSGAVWLEPTHWMPLPAGPEQ